MTIFSSTNFKSFGLVPAPTNRGPTATTIESRRQVTVLVYIFTTADDLFALLFIYLFIYLFADNNNHAASSTQQLVIKLY